MVFKMSSKGSLNCLETVFWGTFGILLGYLWKTLGYFGGTFGIAVGPLWAYVCDRKNNHFGTHVWDHCGVNLGLVLGSLWAQFWYHIGITLGAHLGSH